MLPPRHDMGFMSDQTELYPQKPLDDCYIKNAALLPNVKAPQSGRALSTEGGTTSIMALQYQSAS